MALTVTYNGADYSIDGATIKAHGATYDAARDPIHKLELDGMLADYAAGACAITLAQGLDDLLLDAGAIVHDEWHGYLTPEALADAELEAEYEADHVRELRANYYASR